MNRIANSIFIPSILSYRLRLEGVSRDKQEALVIHSEKPDNRMLFALYGCSSKKKQEIPTQRNLLWYSILLFLSASRIKQAVRLFRSNTPCRFSFHLSRLIKQVYFCHLSENRNETFRIPLPLNSTGEAALAA